MLTADEVRAMLRRHCEGEGSQKAWADKHGISPQYVNDVLSGHREPGALICRAFNLQRVAVYEMLPVRKARGEP